MTYDQKQPGTALMLYLGSSQTTPTSSVLCDDLFESDCQWLGQFNQCSQMGSLSRLVNFQSPDWYLMAPQCLGYGLPEAPTIAHKVHREVSSATIICDAFGQQLDRSKSLGTFVVGPENSAAFEKILDPACGSGSLLIHGANGAGKSHLLSALALAAIQQGQSVRFLTAEYLFWRFATGRLDADLQRPDPSVDLFLLDNAEYFESKTISSDFKKAIALLKGYARRMVVASKEVPWTMVDLDPAVHALLFQELAVELKPLRPETLHWMNQDQRVGLGKADSDDEWRKPHSSPIDENWSTFLAQISSDPFIEPSPWVKLGRLFDVYLAVDSVATLYDASLTEVLSSHAHAVLPEARSVLLFLLAEDLRLELKDVADCFGEPVAVAEKIRASVKYELGERGRVFERVSILRKSIVDGLAKKQLHFDPSVVMK